MMNKYPTWMAKRKTPCTDNRNELHKRIVKTDQVQGGFFLVELLVALFILAVVTSVAVPIWIHVQTKAHEAHLESEAYNVVYNEAASFFSTGRAENTTFTVQGYKGKGYKGSGAFEYRVEWQKDGDGGQQCGAAEAWQLKVGWDDAKDRSQHMIVPLCKTNHRLSNKEGAGRFEQTR